MLLSMHSFGPREHWNHKCELQLGDACWCEILLMPSYHHNLPKLRSHGIATMQIKYSEDIKIQQCNFQNLMKLGHGKCPKKEKLYFLLLIQTVFTFIQNAHDRTKKGESICLFH